MGGNETARPKHPTEETTMTDFARNMTNELLAAHSKALDWQVKQSQVVEKQVLASFEATRAAVELQRDMTQSMTKTLVDVMLPKKDESKA